jgi:hypothetical protein
VHVLRLPVDDDGVVAVADGVEDGSFRIELLALLVVVRDRDVRSASDLAGIRLQLTNQHAQHRRFPGAIGPHEADTVAAHQSDRSVGHDEFPVERLGNPTGFDHQLPGAIAGVGLEPHHARMGTAGRALRPHGQERADAALITRAPRFDALAQPRFLRRQPLVEFRLLCRLAGKRRFLVANKRRVIARP